MEVNQSSLTFKHITHFIHSFSIPILSCFTTVSYVTRALNLSQLEEAGYTTITPWVRLESWILHLSPINSYLANFEKVNITRLRIVLCVPATRAQFLPFVQSVCWSLAHYVWLERHKHCKHKKQHFKNKNE